MRKPGFNLLLALTLAVLSFSTVFSGRVPGDAFSRKDGSSSPAAAVGYVADSVRKTVGDAENGSDQVLRFAAEHHPELAALLRQLRKAQSPEFERAVGELSIQISRLERVRERTPQRYELELKSWKLESETKLLLARWAMSQDPALESEIRRLLRERRLIRIALLEMEQHRLQERLAVVSSQLTDAGTNLDGQIDSEWQQLSRKAGAKRKTRTTAKTGVNGNTSAAKGGKARTSADGTVKPQPGNGQAAGRNGKPGSTGPANGKPF